MLSTKPASVLNILVNNNVQTAIPVVSEDIGRLGRTKVSSSTVLHAMSQLTGEGYISRHHVSAGDMQSKLGCWPSRNGLREEPSDMIRERESGGLLDHHMDGRRLLLNRPELSQ